MSHEIRTPLNGLIGMLTLLSDSNLDDSQLGYVQTATLSSKALLRIVNDILDFSKVEAGKLELENVPFEIGAVIQEISDLFSPQMREKGLNFPCLVDGSIPMILGDPGRLRQVLANLIGNSIKFTKAGSVKLSVTQSHSSDEKITLHFEITDTGIGLDDEQIQRLFEAFSQGDVSTTRRYGGTGLGLTICRQLLQLMGADLKVISSLGEGSTFWFEIQFQLATKSLPERSASINQKAKINKSLSGTVLVAEDNPINQKVIVAFLQAFGCEVVVANNGQEVLEKVETQHFDAILMDCHMPVMDGFEATRRIRLFTGRLASIPIIAVTASALPQERDRCLRAGMNDFIAKPITPEALENVVRTYLTYDITSEDSRLM